jgi:hypothetical protein
MYYVYVNTAYGPVALWTVYPKGTNPGGAWRFTGYTGSLAACQAYVANARRGR